MMATTTRASAEWITGMDCCIRGLGHALAQAREFNIDDIPLASMESEVEAITEHWERVRGPMPPEEA